MNFKGSFIEVLKNVFEEDVKNPICNNCTFRRWLMVKAEVNHCAGDVIQKTNWLCALCFTQEVLKIDLSCDQVQALSELIDPSKGK